MQFTCNTCALVFASAEEQRVHMKSDWHRYNLKRRVAQLPAIDENVFNSKVASLSADGTTPAPAKTQNKQVTKKELRRREKEAIHEQKKQILEIARQNMLASSQERPETEAEAEEAPVSEDQDLTEEQLAEKLMAIKLANQVHIPATTCLFCHPKDKKNFTTVEENNEHMFKLHGFYIPEQKYLQDMTGLIEYLGEKIGLGNVCLCCSYQGRNIEAVREHMRVKRHMKVPYEKEDDKYEISQFYDFSSTYEDATTADANDANGADDWEDVSGDEDTVSEVDGESDDEVDAQDDLLVNNGHELVLPSGAVVGHRSMARYYRQNLAPERILSEGQGTVIAAETRHMLKVKDRQELATQKRAWARQQKREDQNDRRAQKFINNQPHFRDPLLQ